MTDRTPHTTAAPAKPTVVYDGDCSFCKFWIGRWQRLTQDRVTYVPFQEVPEEFCGISRKQFKKSVYLITKYGQRLRGAEAVAVLLKISGHSGTWNWLYHHLPLAGRIAERSYRLVADNRNTFYKLTKLLLFPKI